ncbi:hypothetical protein ACIQLJ_12875 [Microbacterium sp. NPDC091313]
MDTRREKPPIEPTVEPDTSTAAEPEDEHLDAEDAPSLDASTHEGVDRLEE